MKYQSSSNHCSKVISKVKFSKIGVKRQGHRVKNKGLITGNIHVNYQSSSIHCLKVISKVKVFKKWVKLQRIKINLIHVTYQIKL